MKARVVAFLGVGAALAVGSYLAVHRAPVPLDAKSVERALASSAMASLKSTPNCTTFFAEWDGLIGDLSQLDERKVGQLSGQIGRYPGIPLGTYQVWKILATQLPPSADIDLSFAFGLADCEYERFLKTSARLLSGAKRAGIKGQSGRHLAGAVFGVLREVLERPVSRQAALQTVSLVRQLQGMGWLLWGEDDGAEWDRNFEYLQQFNAQAEAREREQTEKVFKAASFKDIVVEDRRGITVQLGYTFSQIEKFRLKLAPHLSRIKVSSE